MDNKHDPACLPKEILDIAWSNTSEERLKEAYKVWADTYDKWANGAQQDSSPGYVGHIRCAEIFNTAASELYGDIEKKNLKLLDLGCGTGLLGQVLKEKYGFDNMVGLDLSEEMLAKSREKGVYKRLICSYVTNERVTDIENAEFDGVLAAGVFTPGQIKPTVLDEILRWIKPGGIICFTCRSDAYESEEYSYKDKFESLEIQRRWESISNSESDYYGDHPPPERRSLRARLLVYRILPF